MRKRREGGYDPAAVAVRLAASGLFDESVVYERDGRWWFAGGAVAAVTIHRDTVRAWTGEAGEAGEADEGRTVSGLPESPVRSVAWTGSPARAIDVLLAELPIEDWRLYGRLDHELAFAVAGLPLSGDADRELGRLTVPRVEVGVDERSLTVRALNAADLDRVLSAALGAGDEAPAAAPRPVDVEDAEPGPYLAAVAATVDRIRAGELEKVILSRRVAVPYDVDFPATYLRGRRANTPARSFLLDLPGLRAAGFSPQTVVEVDADGSITTRPLAGTCPRGDDPAFDARRRAALLGDAKEVYEHAVSVRVADAELRALCEPDSVAIDAFMVVEERGSVHHIASRVSGRLDARHGPWDALVALFPAVTVSGVPKADAYPVIAEYEATPRGLYAGAVVRATHTGELDAALALRMVHTQDGGTWLRAGAGIVRDSRPVREYRETCHELATVAPHVVPSSDTPEPELPAA
ncbi:salicylate synthase [Streptomyces sp. SID3343]|nr:salicylate synthase [Streptomyces sp. SID3343]MYW02232.1 salicylate synthase [Streptomyces sp. SID3343]